ncbi:GtrA family protein, partial [Bacteroides sp.]|uniref:GtrA family protein n=1 Tax=Bacteroides sp. TaxID=29523 RepID=UPI00345D5E5F
MEKNKTLFQQILRFAVVGGGAFVIDYGIMVFLTEVVGINYLVSSGISFTVS